MSNIEQITNAPNLYVNNLQVAYVSSTTITMAPGAARDSTNIADLILNEPAVINGAINGANGLDTGSLANNTWYAVFIIGSSIDQTVSATLLSTSSSSPILPFNYDLKRLIGWVLTDGGAHFLNFRIYGNASARIHRWDSVINELTNTGNNTFTQLDLSSSVCPDAEIVYLKYEYSPQSAGTQFNLRPTGSTSTSTIALSGMVASVGQFGMVEAECNSAQLIDWKTASSFDSLYLYTDGFTYFI